MKFYARATMRSDRYTPADIAQSVPSNEANLFANLFAKALPPCR